MRERRNDNFIKCPNCGAQYTFTEIFIPKYFCGNSDGIEREAGTGKIKDFYGKLMDTKEIYTCDYCNTTFKVFANISFNTKIANKTDFEEDYKTVYKKVSLFMEED